MTTTFGASALSRSVKRPPEHERDAHHVEEVRRDDEAVDAVTVALYPALAGRRGPGRRCWSCSDAARQQGRLRHRSAADARYGRQPLEEIAIEPRHARLVVAVQRGVDAEEQQVLRD